MQLLCGSHVQKVRSCLTKLPVARICIILRILTISCGTSFRYVLAATFGYVQISTRPRFRRLLRKSAPLFAVTVWITLCGSHVQKARSHRSQLPIARICTYLLFQVLKKKQKGTGDYYRDCVPDPATLFWIDSTQTRVF